jgi:hypothetical protein
MASSTKANMSTVTSILTEDDLKNLSEMYDLLPEYEAELPAPGKTAMDAPPGKIAMYSHVFTTRHLRIPVSKFLISILRHYKLHITQVVPVSLHKVFHYEYCVRALKGIPQVPQFCAFYKLTKAEDWFTFSKRDSLPNHVEYVPSSLKLWKESFFYINARIFPITMSFRDIKLKFKDDPPPTVAYANTIYNYLC